MKFRGLNEYARGESGEFFGGGGYPIHIGDAFAKIPPSQNTWIFCADSSQIQLDPELL